MIDCEFYTNSILEVSASSQAAGQSNSTMIEVEESYEQEEVQQGDVLEQELKAHQKQMVITYEQKRMKMNLILEGKRMKNNPLQTIGIPFPMNNSIKFGQMFEIFGGITIASQPPSISGGRLAMHVMTKTKKECMVVPPVVSFNKITRFSEVRINSYQTRACKFDYIAEILRNSYGYQVQDLVNLLLQYQKEVDRITSKTRFFDSISSMMYAEIEEDYIAFQNYSREYIRSYHKKGMMMKYIVGRMNYALGDISIATIGLSEEYMQMIGLNHDLFAFVQLRGSWPDIVPECNGEVESTCQQIRQRILKEEDVPIQVFDVTTIDGFTLTIQKIFRKIISPIKRHAKTEYDHLFYIEEFNVGENQLQALQRYREGLAMQKERDVSLEKHLHFELSSFFEHVEYSVYSQLFLEKFYKK